MGNDTETETKIELSGASCRDMRGWEAMRVRVRYERLLDDRSMNDDRWSMMMFDCCLLYELAPTEIAYNRTDACMKIPKPKLKNCVMARI
jgi:hypothetical protein